MSIAYIERIALMERLLDVDMREYTTFRAGGRAAEMVICSNTEELSEIMEEIKKENKLYLLIGNGSDMLFKDEGYSGTIVKLGEDFQKIERDGDFVKAGAALLLSKVANFALEEELAGFEFASGIPGSVGGALFMNAGAYGGEMKDIVVSATIMDSEGNVREVPVEDMDLSYRHSIFQSNNAIILFVKYKLSKGDKDMIKAEIKEFTLKRNTKQPIEYPSAGSFFKRPEGYFAGKLIQDSGLKGMSVGGAQVSEKHSGFVINKGGATATDILDLMHLIQNTVYDKFGVKMEPEVRIIGRNGQENA